MKTSQTIHQIVIRRITPVTARPIGLGISAFVLFLLVGCATQRPAGITHAGVLLADPLALEPGTIGVLAPVAPAAFGFDKAAGQIESASHVAGNYARETLVNVGSEPMLGGAIAFAAAPIGAVVGAVSGAQHMLPHDKLAASESNLITAMSSMAGQERFRDSVLIAAAVKTQRQLVPVASLATAAEGPDHVGTVLETTIEDLRLERTGSSDTSFALRIKARARLIRTADGGILYDQPFEYQSRTGLFLDWTLGNAFQNVADTGYRVLAENMAGQLFAVPTERPMRLGAGYKKSPVPALPTAREPVVGQVPAPGDPVQFVDYRPDDWGSLGIYSTANTFVALQRPLTKDEAVSEGVRDVERTLDGLYNSTNPYVSLLAIVPAIPMSLWKQTVGAVRGVNGEQFRKADRKMSAAAWQARPQDELAYQVAEQLTPKTSEALALVRSDGGLNGRPEALPVSVSESQPHYVTLPAPPRNQTVAAYLVSQGIETALEIHVIGAVLKGSDGINPPRALCVEARATLLRASDGVELYSCPVRYRSRDYKFTEWAAQDARLFREELEQCSRDLGGAIVNQLVARRLIAPGRATNSLLVTK